MVKEGIINQDMLHIRTFETPEMYRHIALDAFPVIFCNYFFQSQWELVLGQPISNFDLCGHHGRLKRTQLLSHGPFRAGSGLRTHLCHSVFDSHFSRHPRVKLDGERGVAVGGFGGRRCTGLQVSTRGGFPARFSCRQSVLSWDLKVTGLLIGRFMDFCTFFSV